MPEGVQGVSRSSIVEDHQCSLLHRALKLNVYAAHLPAHGTCCSFGRPTS